MDMDELSRALHTEIEELHPEIGSLKSELEEIWENERKVPYELTSVFIHRGSTPTFGHYFFYSRNLPDSPDQWFKYNDSEVSVISKEEVLADTTGSTANPYLVCVRHSYLAQFELIGVLYVAGLCAKGQQRC